MIRLITTILLLGLGPAASACAQATEHGASPRVIAEAWLNAYSEGDFERMTALMTADTVFIDPTSFEIDGIDERIEWRGPEAITRGVAAWGVDHGSYTIDRTYEASGQVVFNGHIDVVYIVDTSSVTYRFPITTIIAVVDGHVAEHRDYTDFAGAHVIQPTP